VSEPFGDLITPQQTDPKRARNELIRLEDAVGLVHTPRPTAMEFMNEIGELAWTNLVLWLIRGVDARPLVQNYPSRAGCIVLPPPG
jgi:hypothetical protein